MSDGETEWSDLTWPVQRPAESGDVKWRAIRFFTRCDDQTFWDFCQAFNRFMQVWPTTQAPEWGDEYFTTR